jgi:hypothetical protein
MDIDKFYSLVAGTCFALVGLWWNVVRANPDWLRSNTTRRLAGGVYASFLLPGVMSLMAQIGGSENRIWWRLVFVVAAVFGMVFTTRLLIVTRAIGTPRLFRSNVWIVGVVYVFVLVVALFPGLGQLVGFTGLQVEAIFLSILILLAHGLTWEFMTEAK